ncbi:unnamed protein product [Chrysodeixis includens]|uniref:Uncharacterized protein n=1 Tax=Chrysodeixis includens TaxID=689277 RepID=A0A9N8PZM8_CHRIL|nr:unnamed protein product [Chrysodeixis includens]
MRRVRAARPLALGRREAAGECAASSHSEDDKARNRGSRDAWAAMLGGSGRHVTGPSPLTFAIKIIVLQTCWMFTNSYFCSVPAKNSRRNKKTAEPPPGRAEPGRAASGRTEPRRAAPSRTEPHRAAPGHLQQTRDRN